MILYTTFKRNGECSIKVFNVTCILFGRNRICIEPTEAEVARAKNVFKTNLFMQLDGTVSYLSILIFTVNSQDLHQCVRILEGNFMPIFSCNSMNRCLL